ncbi:KGK domain-containing protein [Nostoc sp. PA-18-2419]|uniref:KGK domain-containing protein n=1 Tax=Nostoc sp. PA-18-2419 TaxID=2575443 RepID=UPI0011085316|nr:KGK domain-containing protein [Nostoc sp. PA-18-2419]
MSDEIVLDNDDVVCFGAEDYSFSKAPTATVNEIKSSLLKTWLAGHLSGWIGNGIACKVLLVRGGGWQAGRVRFRLEFMPNEPKVSRKEPSSTSESKSPLDDLRSDLKV